MVVARPIWSAPSPTAGAMACPVGQSPGGLRVDRFVQAAHRSTGRTNARTHRQEERMTRQLTVITLTGDARTRGRQYGEEARGLIHQALDAMEAQLSSGSRLLEDGGNRVAG